MATKHKRLINVVSMGAVVLLLFNLRGEAQSDIRNNILNMTEKLQKDNQVHFGYPVGFAGRPETDNKFYKLYNRLKLKATTQELVQLTKSTSVVIVVYAFDILQERNYGELKNIFLDHINDTCWFWTAGGCSGVLDRVNWFMLRRLKPIEGEVSHSLTRSEYDMYCSRFKKEDELFSCN